MVCFGVLPGNGQRVGAQVNGRDVTVRALAGDGHGNRAAAGAEIKDFGPVLIGDSFQGGLHEQFRFRPGDQGMAVHPECHGTEFLLPGQVSDGVPGAPAVQQAQEIRDGTLRRGHFRAGVQAAPVRSECGREQHLGIKARSIRSAEAAAGKLQ